MSDINPAIVSASDTGTEIMLDSADDSMGEHINRSAIQATAIGVAVATGATFTAKRILTHPLVIFGLGCALGYVAYQYRNEIRAMLRREH